MRPLNTDIDCVLIDPAKKQVKLHTWSGELDDLYKLLNCQTVDGRRLGAFDRKAVIGYLDDEGLLHDNKPMHYFTFDGSKLLLAGPMLLCGIGATGNEVDCPVSVEHVTSTVLFLGDVHGAIAAINDGTIDRPCTQIICGGKTETVWEWKPEEDMADGV
jgi:hypothetical protein